MPRPRGPKAHKTASQELSLAQFIKPPKAKKTNRNVIHYATGPNLEQAAPSNVQASTNSSRAESEAQALLNSVDPLIHRLTHYGNTEALIHDFFRDAKGDIKRFCHLDLTPSEMRAGRWNAAWLEEKQRRVSDNTSMLEVDDYGAEAPATCQPAKVALAPYARFKKLYGERKFAGHYTTYGRTPSSSSLSLSSSKKPIGFLDLPSEIRNRIYHEWLVFDQPFELLPKSSLQTRKRPGRAMEDSEKLYSRKTCAARRILRLNKKINQEASAIFYGSNEFRFTQVLGWSWLRGFMETIGEANAARLRKVTVHIHWPGKIEDISDAWYPHEGHQLQRRIDMFSDFKPLDKYRSPALAYKECMEIFHQAGELAELKLVLPNAYQVYNVWDLNLDHSKFKHKVEVKLIQLSTDRSDKTAMNHHDTQVPLRKTYAPRKTRGRKKTVGPDQLIQEYTSPKAYAKSQGWPYARAFCEIDGKYLEEVDGEEE